MAKQSVIVALGTESSNNWELHWLPCVFESSGRGTGGRSDCGAVPGARGWGHRTGHRHGRLRWPMVLKEGEAQPRPRPGRVHKAGNQGVEPNGVEHSSKAKGTGVLWAGDQKEKGKRGGGGNREWVGVFIEIWLIYDVRLVSGIQHSDSISCIHNMYSFSDPFILQVITRS